MKNPIILTSILFSSSAFAQNISYPSFFLSGDWLKGDPVINGRPSSQIDVAPSAAGFNKLVARVAALEGRANTFEACMATDQELADGLGAQTLARENGLSHLREELCASVGQLQNAVCKDPILIERLETFVEAKLAELLKSEREKLKEELKSELRAELKQK